jgi:hypothetical protein
MINRPWRKPTLLIHKGTLHLAGAGMLGHFVSRVAAFAVHKGELIKSHGILHRIFSPPSCWWYRRLHFLSRSFKSGHGGPV